RSGKGDGGLKAGKTHIWLCSTSRGFNLDYFTMTSLDDHGQPWQGVPAVVSGTVQAEEFDEGGEGVAYSDSSEGNNKGAFRPNEDVDINAMDDGGFNVGYITAGEFLRYTVDVTKKIDDVFFTFRVASADGLGSFRIVSGGTGCDDYTTDLSGLVKVPSTGGNIRYEDLPVNGNGTGGLRAQKTIMWLCVESKSFNIDYFTISNIGEPEPLPTPTPDPYGGIPAAIPGYIQAEEFDFGGEGVGYSDSTAGNNKGGFRPNEDVDIDELDDGGFNVGFVATGEYLRYSVDVTQKIDDVHFLFRVASPDDLGSFRVVTGDNDCNDYTTDLSGLVQVPNTGGNNRYQDVKVNGNGTGGLRATENIIWLCIESKSFNIDYFYASKTGVPPTDPTTPTIPVEEGDPWGGVAATVPGVVQAEEFDMGGEGVAYSDSSEGNNKGAFRPHEDVDINAMDDGFNVGYVSVGEYLRYTVDVTQKIDNVFFNFRVASADGLGSFRIVSGGTGCDDYTTDLSGLVKVPSTGGNIRYQDLAVNGNGTGGLRAQETKIWLCIESKSFNIDYFTMSKTATAFDAHSGGPYGGTSAMIPGLIQAGKLDLGGQGVGYSDSSTKTSGG
ncbi:unnamed protein product, partial [Laminaria digitata]